MREMSRQVRTFDDVVERPRIELQGRFKNQEGPAKVRTFTPEQIAKLKLAKPPEEHRKPHGAIAIRPDFDVPHKGYR